MVKVEPYISRLLFMLILPFTGLIAIFERAFFEGAITLGNWLK